MHNLPRELEDKLKLYREVAQLFRRELPPSEAGKIDEVMKRLENLRIVISAFGLTNAGKSALLNSLLGISNQDPNRPFGSSPRPNMWNDHLEKNNAVVWKKMEGLEIVISDTPGIGGDFPEHLEKAKQIAESSDIVLYVVWAAVTGSEQTAAMRTLLSSGKPLIIAINKVDTYREVEINAIKEDLLKKMPELKEDMFVLTAGEPLRGDPIILPLVEQITTVVQARQESLIWNTVDKYFKDKSEEVTRIIIGKKISQSHKVIHTAAVSAAAASAAIPTPLDEPVLTAIHIAMVQGLASMFNQSLDKSAAVTILGLVGGAVAGKTVANFALNFLPGIGNALRAATTFTHTEALGWAAHKYFKEGYKPLPSLAPA